MEVNKITKLGSEILSGLETDTRILLLTQLRFPFTGHLLNSFISLAIILNIYLS